MKTPIMYLLLILILSAVNKDTALGQGIDTTGIRVINVSFYSDGFLVKGRLFIPSDSINRLVQK
jgi:hypothetical protein